MGVATLGDRLCAFGGFIEQNRTPHDEAFRFDGARWERIRRLPEACGAMACIALGSRIHLIGGAIGSDWRRSIDWHGVYDPASDRYEKRQPLPVARDHIGIVVVGPSIHVIGGRVDSFHTNSSLHHSYDAQADRWVSHAPMITPRHGMGAVVIGDEIIVAGGGPQMGGGVKSAINESFTLA